MLFFTSMLSITGLASQKTNVTPSPTIYNDPPSPPEISGPTSGQINTLYTYSFLVTDPNEDLLEKMEINWGVGEIEEVCAGCTGPRWPSGSTQEVEHKWTQQGDFSVSARVMDVYGEWSEWSDPFSVTMPKSKYFMNSFFMISLEFFTLLQNILKI